MARAPLGRTIVAVGVAGGTGSGKTTFARALCAALPPGAAAVLDHDAYYRDLSHLPLEERCRVNFDHPDALENELLADQLDTLARGEPIEKPCYDFATHTRLGRREHVAPVAVLVVEGILVLADPRLRERLDLRLFVDASADVRLLRRIRRDIVERGRAIDDVAAQYAATVRPMHAAFVEPSRAFADLVVPGEGDFSAALRIAADGLRHRLRLG